MMAKLKIAMLHPFFEERGGAERKALLITRGLIERGHEVTVFTFKKNPEKSFKEWMEGIKFVEIPYGKSFFAKFKSIKNLGLAAKGFDVIHCHNFPANISGAFAKKKYGTPVVYYCNEPLLYEKGTIEKTSRILLFIERLIEKNYMKKINLVVGNSDFTTKRISKIFGVKAVTRYSGIYTDKFIPIKRQSEVPTIFVQNRLMPEKRIDIMKDVMTAVWKQVPSARLVIGGAGPDEFRLKQLLDDKRVSFTGAVDFEVLIKNYQNSDVFAFTALNEPLGITPVEAMSCGVPVVAFNSGGPKETILDGKTGYLVESNDEFAKKIIAILKNQSLRQKLGVEARKRAVSIFSIEAQTDGALSCYKQVLKAKGKP